MAWLDQEFQPAPAPEFSPPNGKNPWIGMGAWLWRSEVSQPGFGLWISIPKNPLPPAGRDLGSSQIHSQILWDLSPEAPKFPPSCCSQVQIPCGIRREFGIVAPSQESAQECGPAASLGGIFPSRKIPNGIFFPSFPQQGTAGSPWAEIGQLQLLPSDSRSLIFLWKSGSRLCPVRERLVLEMSNSVIPDLSHGKELPEAPRDGSPGGCDWLGFGIWDFSLQNSALILSGKSQAGNSCHKLCARREAGKSGITGCWKASNPLLKSLEFSASDFLFPTRFSRQIPLFFFPPLRRIHRTANPEEGALFSHEKSMGGGIFQKAGKPQFQGEQKKRLRGGNSSSQKFQVFFLFSASSRQINGSYI